jgi:hypothetical protein
MTVRAIEPDPRLFARAVQFATSDEPIEDLSSVGDCLALYVDGVHAASWLQQTDRDGVLRILAYEGRGPIDLTAFLNGAIEAQCPRAGQFQTRRRGLVKKAQALGWRIVGEAPLAGVIMRKDFQ